MSVTGAYASKKTMFAKVRRGGPWSRELGLYYKLLEDSDIAPIDDQQALRYQENVNQKSDKVSLSYKFVFKFFSCA